MDTNMSLKKHIDDQYQKCKRLIQRINWIPNKFATVQDKIILWKSLVRQTLNYGIVLMANLKPTYQDLWTNKLKTTFRKTLGLARVYDKEIFKLIYDQENTLKRSKIIIKITESKWMSYLSNVPIQIDEYEKVDEINQEIT